jgi:hypothetical protein
VGEYCDVVGEYCDVVGEYCDEGESTVMLWKITVIMGRVL